MATDSSRSRRVYDADFIGARFIHPGRTAAEGPVLGLSNRCRAHDAVGCCQPAAAASRYEYSVLPGSCRKAPPQAEIVQRSIRTQVARSETRRRFKLATDWEP